MDLSFGEEDETSRKEGNPGSRGLNEAYRINPDFLAGENVNVSYLDRKNGDCSGGQANEYMGSQAGRAIAPLPFCSDERAEDGSQQ
jgi:hypothetical protein